MIVFLCLLSFKCFAPVKCSCLQMFCEILSKVAVINPNDPESIVDFCVYALKQLKNVFSISNCISLTTLFWRMKASDSIYFLDLFSVFSGGCFAARALLPPSRPIRVSDPSDPLRQTSVLMIVLVPPCLSKTALCSSPVWAGSLSTSSCWIKSSVSTLAARQQRSDFGGRPMKTQQSPSTHSDSDEDEHGGETRVCLTSVWGFHR